MIIPALLMSQKRWAERDKQREWEQKDMQEVLDSIPFPKEQLEITRKLMEVGKVPK